MQIHEVFGLGSSLAGVTSTAGAMLKDPKSFIDPTRFAQARQAGYDASAAKSAEKLRRQGYGQPVTAPNVNQLISQVQADSAAQQLVRTWAAQWPKIAANIPPAPPAPPPSAAPTAPEEPLFFGGQQLNPNDPNDARIIAQAKAQGKLEEQQSAAPDPTQYRKKFVEWADDVVERTARQPGVIEAMKQESGWAQQFKQAEDAVVSTIDNAQENTQAVQAYLTLAVAAARAYQQERPSAANRAQVTSGLNDPQANALATTLGLDAADVAKLNAFMRRNNETINPQGTGSASLDALLRAAKLLK